MTVAQVLLFQSVGNQKQKRGHQLMFQIESQFKETGFFVLANQSPHCLETLYK